MHANLCGLAIIYSQVSFNCFVYVSRSLKHAWRRAADHDMVFAHLAAVEHGVECGNLVYSDGRHIQDFCNLSTRDKTNVGNPNSCSCCDNMQLRVTGHLVHGAQTKPAFVLYLCKVQDWDHG